MTRIVYKCVEYVQLLCSSLQRLREIRFDRERIREANSQLN